MDPRDTPEVDVDFSGDSEGYIPDAHLAKRFPVTEIAVAEIELKKAA